MVKQKTREWAKHILWISRAKLIYTRVTLTRYTTLYFFLAFVGSVTLVILQTATYASNTEGAHAVSAFVAEADVDTATIGMSFLSGGDVLLCKNIPGQAMDNCTTLIPRMHSHSHLHVRDLPLDSPLDSPLDLDTRDAANLERCGVSLIWLADVLLDARREDLVILAYELWLFSLSIVTLLNESLPHLFAGLAARVLATAWAGFRVRGNQNLYGTYRHVVDAGPCAGFDPMGGWWGDNDMHAVAALICNAVNLVLIAALSWKLYQVYARQTFSRVGASPEIHRVYKLVLILSVSLQLAGFFQLAQTALWIGKISTGAIRQLADHFALYLAELIVTAVFTLPWLVLGWISVRRESKVLFVLFAGISLLLFGMATATFFSPLYLFVLQEWSFYATISLTSYVLLVATFALAVVCRLQFGKGFAHFLKVSDALDDGDFTPVYFPKDRDSPMSFDEKRPSLSDAALPGLSYASPSPSQSTPATKANALKRPSDAATRHGRKPSTLSVYMAAPAGTGTIHLSTTPALLAQTAPPPRTSAQLAGPVIIPLERSTSMVGNSTSPSRHRLAKAKRPPPPDVPVGPGPGAPAGSVDDAERRSRAAAEPAKPPTAAVRAQSGPRHVSPIERAPAGNYF